MRIVGVRFRPVDRVYYFDAGDMELEVGDWVIAEGMFGPDLARVVIAPRQVVGSELTEPLKPVIRRAEARDLEMRASFRAQESEAFRIMKECIDAHGLPMRLVRTEYTYDGGRVIGYFTAEGRVDFRELVRDLARAFHTRIELRQINAREGVKLAGGMGRCGQPLCCTTFLTSFPAISVKMAREQDISPETSRITGACGRLLCCLRYELENYTQGKRELPEVGQSFPSPAGVGTVVGTNVIKRSVTVRLPSGATIEVPVSQGRPTAVGPGCAGCPIAAPLPASGTAASSPEAFKVS